MLFSGSNSNNWNEGTFHRVVLLRGWILEIHLIINNVVDTKQTKTFRFNLLHKKWTKFKLICFFFFISSLIIGPRVFYNPQDILWRRKLEEQAELEQALELQNRRLMNLQLLQVTKHQRALSTGSPVQSPLHSPSVFNNQNLMLSSIPRGTTFWLILSTYD